MGPSKKYENLETSIQKILKEKITVSDAESKKAKKCLNEIFHALESKMRKNEAFYALFRQKQYVGSFYENLKIDEPDEFDIDFELHVPSYIGELQICESDQPGFCQLKLHQDSSPVSDPQKVEARKQVSKWTDTEGFISRNKVNQWMQSVVDKALDEYEQTNDQKTFEFDRSCSGPAVTLSVTLVEHPELRFALDFVPVFVFEDWPTVDNLRKWEPEMEVEKWYAVPKSYDNYKDFRLCFWHQEKYMLCGTNHMKSVLKLIKKLRDVQQWTGLASYYIKTMFLWKTANNDKSYWRKGAASIFIEMLNELKNYLLTHNALPFFWIEEFDLLSQMKVAEKQNIGGYIRNMLKDIEKNLDVPGFLEKYFDPSNRTVDRDLELRQDTSTVARWEPVDRRPVNRSSQLVTRQDENNTGTAIAAIAVGAAAIFGVGLLAHLLTDNRRARQ